MTKGFGGTRIVDMLVGEQLPRICRFGAQIAGPHYYGE
jgi:hypothetical protein